MENYYFRQVSSSYHNVELNILNRLAYLIGLTLWFPSFAILNIGNRVGLQLVLPLAMFYCFLMVYSSSKINKKIFFVVFFWIFILLLSVFSSKYPQDSFLGFLRYLMQFIVLICGSYIVMGENDRKLFIKGYIFGAVISSLYAIYQYFAFAYSLPFSTLLQNNVSQPLKAMYYGNGNFDARSFAFTPEPSVLISLLLPALMIQIVIVINKTSRKSIGRLILFLIALVFSGSMSGYAVLLMTVMILILHPSMFRRFSKLIILLFFTVFFLMILLISIPSVADIIFSVVSRFLAIPDQIVALSTLSTVRGYGYDYSTLSRFASIVAGVHAFLDNPLFGWGTGAGVAEAISSQIPSNIEQRTGASSFPVQIAAEQGIGGLLLLTYLTIIAIKNSRKNSIIFAAFIGVMVHSITTSSGLWNISFWVLCGMAASVPSNIENGKNEKEIVEEFE
ncbi:O-antigen ligase family protein [Neobacillus niacini]|uniref:O-antigen ligase family protein n=1 Tax=Neobacillus niacini TaxID=86668 RepID=UPI0007AC2A85|nr:O-antigen ligase family protein [Neobacillus niacini]MEC1524811.1 O-antigen ligase family protein [Neobacillus niacini]